MTEPMSEPVAYLHTMLMEGGQVTHRLSFRNDNPFGEPGKDYSAEYPVTVEALYTATPPAPESRAPTDQAGELLPCPFCGCEAKLWDGGDGHWTVECYDGGCGCMAEIVRATEAEAITAWNTRATFDQAVPSAGVDGLVERLRQFARRQRQYGASSDERIDVTCGLTLLDLDEAADRLEALTKSPAQETVEAIIERCAKRIEEKHTNNVGMVHPMAVSDAAAIRALKPEQLTSTLNEVGND